MTPDIVTTVSAYGNSIEIRTPKNAPDAQHVHTVKFIDAYNELRRREADRLRAAGESEAFVAATLPKPAKIGTRANPVAILRPEVSGGGRWKPPLPLVPWKAPKPLSDKAALAHGLKLDGKSESVLGQSVGHR